MRRCRIGGVGEDDERLGAVVGEGEGGGGGPTSGLRLQPASGHAHGEGERRLDVEVCVGRKK